MSVVKRLYVNLSGCNIVVMLKILNHWLSRIVIGTVNCVLFTFLVKKFISLPLLKYVIDDISLKEGIQNLLSGFVIIGIYSITFYFLERRKIHELALNNFLKELSIGLFSGFSLIFICVLLLYILGFYEVFGLNAIANIILPLTVLIPAAILEEIVFRGIIFRILKERFGTNIALIQAVIFGLAHFGNENATPTSIWFVTMLGIVLSLLYAYTNRIWLPFFFHFGWNFAQVIFGTPLSGETNFKSLIDSKFEGPILLIGSDFGIEDSLFSILFMTLLAVYLYRLNRKKELR